MEFEFRNKSLMYAFRVFGFLAFASFIVFIIWLRPNADEINRSILKKAINLSFHGKIDSIYRDKQHHNTEMIILDNGDIEGLMGSWEPFISVGDSLSKNKHELILKVYKKNRKLIILDYKKDAMTFKYN